MFNVYPAESHSISTNQLAAETEGDSGSRCNVYVTNLPVGVTRKQLAAAFLPYGTVVSTHIILRRKKFPPVGFVQFSTSEMAQHAIAQMDGQEVAGCRVSVRLAHRDKDKGIRAKPCTRLFVANLSPKIPEPELQLLFGKYGSIRWMRMLRSKGAALVEFVDLASATAAKAALHHSLLQSTGALLEVKFAESDEDRTARQVRRPAAFWRTHRPEGLSATSSSSAPEVYCRRELSGLECPEHRMGPRRHST
eukprot:EG_transcript_19829